jgi:hypothetical protein
VLWFTLWFLVILKLPALYLAYIIWWAVKDPPDATAGGAGEDAADDGGPGWRPSRDRGRARRSGGGPHGSPARRPARVPVAPARAASRP